MNDKNIHRDLLVEEYRSKWAYIRHTEELRQKFVEWYVVVFAGLLIFTLKYCLRDFSNKDFETFSTFLSKFALDKVCFFVFVFLFTYSICMHLYLLAQKSNIKLCEARISQIEKQFCKFEPGRLFEIPPFYTYYLLILLYGSIITLLLSISFNGVIFTAFKAAGLYFLSMGFILPFLWNLNDRAMARRLHRREIKMEESSKEEK